MTQNLKSVESAEALSGKKRVVEWRAPHCFRNVVILLLFVAVATPHRVTRSLASGTLVAFLGCMILER
jgi:hypothetical protein